MATGDYNMSSFESRSILRKGFFGFCLIYSVANCFSMICQIFRNWHFLADGAQFDYKKCQDTKKMLSKSDTKLATLNDVRYLIFSNNHFMDQGYIERPGISRHFSDDVSF